MEASIFSSFENCNQLLKEFEVEKIPRTLSMHFGTTAGNGNQGFDTF